MARFFVAVEDFELGVPRRKCVDSPSEGVHGRVARRVDEMHGPFDVRVLRTDEESVIARHTAQLLGAA